MDWKTYIHSDPKVLLGKPVIKGTRLSVEFILGLFSEGWTEQQVLENYPTLNTRSLQAVRQWIFDIDYQRWDEQIERDIAEGKLDALAEEAISELRPEYDFAQMQGGVRGKYVQRYKTAQEEEPVLQAGATYEIWSPLDSHEAAHKLAQLLELE
jgi:uncharacterized protein (DUF433 family)